MDKFLSDCAVNVQRLASSYPFISAGASIFFGMIWCFFGYRIFRPLVVMTVALGGALIGYSCALAVSASHVAWIVGAMIGAICGGVAGFLFVYVIVFLMGFCLMGSAAWIFFAATQSLPQQSIPLAALILGAAGGLLAVLIKRPLLIVYTSLTGALWVVGTIVDLIVAGPLLKDQKQLDSHFLNNLRPFVMQNWPFILAGIVVLFGAGVVFQFSRSPAGSSEDAEEPEAKPAARAKAA